MPRRRRARATREPEHQVGVDAATLAALIRELPERLAEFLLHRRYPLRGTADAKLLERLMDDPEAAPHPGLLQRSQLAKVWKAHRDELLLRWSFEGKEGLRPFGLICDRDAEEDARQARAFLGGK